MLIRFVYPPPAHGCHGAGCVWMLGRRGDGVWGGLNAGGVLFFLWPVDFGLEEGKGDLRWVVEVVNGAPPTPPPQ